MNRSAFQASAQEVQQRLTVSQLNARVRQLLEQGLTQVWVEGEVSNFVASAAGHWYFILKDERAQLSSVMFAGRNQLSLHQPKNGDQVQVRGQASLYEGRGQYQLLVEELRFSGEGDLLARLEALKKKLQAEGLFSAERKRPLPAFPQRLGLITSMQGAALHDLLQVLKRRWPLAEVLLYPAQVQGSEAPASLRRALALAQYHGQPELLILARGGGSLEDLQAFNDETLARMVAASHMPVITGVGHETDFTLVDFVSDLRAPTPSAAAEAATPDRAPLMAQVHSLQGRLLHALASRIRRWQQQLDTLALQARRPGSLLVQRQQQVEGLASRLQAQHPGRRLLVQGQALKQLHSRLLAASPLKTCQQKRQRLEELNRRLVSAEERQRAYHQERLQQRANRLQAMSPLQTLSRGYALVKNDQQQVIRSSQQVALGDTLSIQLAEGQLKGRVEQIDP